MQFKFFIIPGGDTVAEDELNKFLRSHNVLTVHHDFLKENGVPCWCYSVEYLPSNTEKGENLSSSGKSSDAKYNEQKSKKDYRNLLTEEEYERFRILRECRRTVAYECSLPAYAVFYDDQLMEICKHPEITVEHLRMIRGVGAKKVDLFGARFVELWTEKKASPPPNDEVSPSEP